MTRTNRLTRSTATAVVTIGLVAAGLVSAGAVTSSAGAVTSSAGAADHGRVARRTPTAFALQASGLGTKVEGGDIAARSDATAYTVIGCTNEAGIQRQNFVATSDLGGAGTAHTVRSKLWTTSNQGVVSSWARHSVAKIVLADSPLGSLQLTGLSSQVRAFHDAKGFHTEADTDIGAITLVPPVGEPTSFKLPTPGNPVDIPGLAHISLGGSHASDSGSAATVYADALRIELLPTHTLIKVAHSRAEINGGIKSGVFSGWSAGMEATGLGDVAKLGRNPLSLMPCQGTDGVVRTKGAVGADPDPKLVLGGMKNSQMGKQSGKKAWGYERSEVSRLNLGDGAAIIDGIVAKASVKRNGSKVTSSSKGSTIGSVTMDGEPQTFPDTGVLEIPGVARLEPGVVERTRTGIHVIGLRITLLDGTGAVINLAQARLNIRGSHR